MQDIEGIQLICQQTDRSDITWKTNFVLCFKTNSLV